MNVLLLAASMTFGLVASASADEFAIKLKPGPGSDIAQTHCSACHSLDYIQMNSPFLDAKGWSAEVTKMINVFGADIDEADAKQIVDYLGQAYRP
jgi:mono/diheme cytochrome c family protein